MTTDRHDPRLDCPTFCETCQIDRVPIAHSREYRGTRAVRRPVAEDNPGSPIIPQVSTDFQITTTRP